MWTHQSKVFVGRYRVLGIISWIRFWSNLESWISLLSNPLLVFKVKGLCSISSLIAADQELESGFSADKNRFWSRCGCRWYTSLYDLILHGLFGRIYAIPNTDWGKNVLKSQILLQREAFSCPTVVKTLQWINVQILQFSNSKLQIPIFPHFVLSQPKPRLLHSF